MLSCRDMWIHGKDKKSYLFFNAFSGQVIMGYSNYSVLSAVAKFTSVLKSNKLKCIVIYYCHQVSLPFIIKLIFFLLLRDFIDPNNTVCIAYLFTFHLANNSRGSEAAIKQGVNNCCQKWIIEETQRRLKKRHI